MTTRRLTLNRLPGRDLPSFTAPTFVPFDTATGSNTLSAADLDRNGRADLVANVRAGQAVRVYRDGGSVGEDDYAGPMLELVPGDFTNDGNPDVLLQTESTALRLLRGDGLGGLTADPDPIPIDVVDIRRWATARIDGDANLDVIIGSQDEIRVLYGDGAGGFTARSIPFAANASLTDDGPPVVADLTGDGVMDLVFSVATYDPDTDTSSFALHILRGDGARNFSHAPGSPMAITVTDLVAGNFSGDARTDLAVFGNFGLQVLRATNNGLVADGPTPMPAGTFSPPTTPLPGPNGYHRLVVSSKDFTNHESWYTSYTGSAARLGGRQESNHLATLNLYPPAVGDFDGDGRVDLAVASEVSGTNGVYYFLAGDDVAPPAGGGLTLKDARHVTFTDVDGDAVTVSASRPIFDQASLARVVQLAAAPDPTNPRQQLQAIDLMALTNPALAQLTTLKVSAVKKAGGDGRVDVGRVVADVDLKSVEIRGDLGAVESGDGTTTTPGLYFLDVASLGRRGTATQAAGGDLASLIRGPLGALKVAESIQDAAVRVEGVGTVAVGSLRLTGSIGRVQVRGALYGGAAAGSGRIDATGSILSVQLGLVQGGSGPDSGVIRSGGDILSAGLGDLSGGTGPGSGRLVAQGLIKTLTVGRVYGDAGAESGTVAAGSLGKVSVGGNVEGGVGVHSGSITAATNATVNNKPVKTTVAVKGTLFGGAGDRSGRIEVTAGDLHTVAVKGMVVGGLGERSGNVSAVKVFDFDIRTGMYGYLDRAAGVIETDYTPDARFTADARPATAGTPVPVRGGTPLPAGYVAGGRARGKSTGTVALAAGEEITLGSASVVARG